MPVFIRFDGVDGSVRSGGASGGVWKTTNFLTNDRASGPGGGPRIVVVDGASVGSRLGSDAVPVSRISLTPGGGGVEGRDVAAKIKVDQLMHSVRSRGSSGKLYVATDAGVYAGASNNRGQLLVGVDKVRLTSTYDAQGRLLVGNDQGVWRSGGARRVSAANNLKQISLGVHNSTSVEIIVTDARGIVVGSHRLPNVTVTGSSGTFTLTFGGQTTGG